MLHFHNLHFLIYYSLNNVLVDFEIIVTKNTKDFEIEKDPTKTFFCHFSFTYWYIMLLLKPPNLKYNVFENFVYSL
jgi:hypothetical protein